MLTCFSSLYKVYFFSHAKPHLKFLGSPKGRRISHFENHLHRVKFVLFKNSYMGEKMSPVPPLTYWRLLLVTIGQLPLKAMKNQWHLRLCIRCTATPRGDWAGGGGALMFEVPPSAECAQGRGEQEEGGEGEGTHLRAARGIKITLIDGRRRTHVDKLTIMFAWNKENVLTGGKCWMRPPCVVSQEGCGSDKLHWRNLEKQEMKSNTSCATWTGLPSEAHASVRTDAHKNLPKSR